MKIRFKFFFLKQAAATAPVLCSVEPPVLENGSCYEEVGMENASISGGKGRQKGAKNTKYALYQQHFEASTSEDLGLKVETYKIQHEGDGPQVGWNNPAANEKKTPPYGHVRIHKCRAVSGYGCESKLKVHSYYDASTEKFHADAAMSVDHNHADENEKLHKKSSVPRRVKAKILELRGAARLPPSKIDQVMQGSSHEGGRGSASFDQIRGFLRNASRGSTDEAGYPHDCVGGLTSMLSGLTLHEIASKHKKEMELQEARGQGGAAAAKGAGSTDLKAFTDIPCFAASIVGDAAALLPPDCAYVAAYACKELPQEYNSSDDEGEPLLPSGTGDFPDVNSTIDLADSDSSAGDDGDGGGGDEGDGGGDADGNSACSSSGASGSGSGRGSCIAGSEADEAPACEMESWLAEGRNIPELSSEYGDWEEQLHFISTQVPALRKHFRPDRKIRSFCSLLKAKGSNNDNNNRKQQ